MKTFINLCIIIDSKHAPHFYETEINRNTNHDRIKYSLLEYNIEEFCVNIQRRFQEEKRQFPSFFTQLLL